MPVGDPKSGPGLRGRAGKLLPAIIAGSIVLLALSFVVVVAVIPKPVEDKKVQPTPAINVSVIPITAIRNFRDTFTIPGSVEPNSVVRVAAEVSGRIERVTTLEGRNVKVGEVLAELNTELLKAVVDQAKASMDLDIRELERVRTLLDRGNATPMEFDQARSKAEVSKATHDAAKAQLDRAVIYAPTAGRLDKVPVKAGEYVMPGKVVAEIVETDPVLVVVEIPERDMRFIKMGQQERIVAEALGGKEFTGRVSFISAVADLASRTTRVELTVPNPAGELKAGQIVTVHMLRRIIPETIMIPLVAVISLESGYQVYVVENGLAQPRDVKLGLLKGREVQVLSGLKESDLLIVRGQYYVGPGQDVRVIGQGNQIEPATRPATEPAGGPATEPAGGDSKTTGGTPVGLMGETPMLRPGGTHAEEAGTTGGTPVGLMGGTPMLRPMGKLISQLRPTGDRRG